MTISVWRYSHLALALTAALFLFLASVTGVILAIESAGNNLAVPPSTAPNQVTLAMALPALGKKYTEINSLSVDEQGRVSIRALDENGDDVQAVIDPATGAVLGTAPKQNDFYKWVTAFHRSLFLHEAGRFFIGLSAFLLMLITVSGLVLVVQRQGGISRFFKKIVRENSAQFYHVTLGRLLLVPVFIIALSGTWLSLVRFGIIPEKKIQHAVPAQPEETVRRPVDSFAIFQQIRFSELRSLEFPFADDPEEYYLLKLRDRELVVNQFDGSILSEEKYPFSNLSAAWSLDLHTGRTSSIWAIVLGIASLNMLVFMYTGFAITLRRRRGRISNKFTAAEAKLVILVGSENGATLQVAVQLHRQLLAAGQVAYLAEANQYGLFPQVQWLLVCTSTYGLGEPPVNATRLLKLIESHPQDHIVQTAVLGFGSDAYPDFCAFGRETHAVLSRQPWAQSLIGFHTVNNQSTEDLLCWIRQWNNLSGITLATTPGLYSQVPEGLKKLKVLERTAADESNTFALTLAPAGVARFTSGDVLAVYPLNDQHERLYSIGRTGKQMRLLVKLHPQGLGSHYLYNLNAGDLIKARIVDSNHFHFPAKAPAVIMVANGTGIAPFLGMLAQNTKAVPCYLYCGFRRRTSLVVQHGQVATDAMEHGRLQGFALALSQEGDKCYVMDLIRRDAAQIAGFLQQGAVLMICGSLAMQQDVEKAVHEIVAARNGHDLAYYREKGQVMTDCY